MILVTGASGQLGRLVIEELKKSVPTNEIIAAVRSPEKATDLASQGIQIRQADYNQPETLNTALAGVKKVLLISSSEVGQRLPQHKNVIDAAKKAGVALIAYTSILRADTSQLSLAQEHKATEAYLASSDIPYALLRNGWYSENYFGSIPAALEHGVVIGSAGEGKISAASRVDYAAAAAAVLTQDNQAGNVYELAGDTGFTMAELAQDISSQAGKAVSYQNLTEDAYVEALLGVGIPEGFAQMLAQSDIAASTGGLFDDSKTLSTLIGRPTLPISETIREGLATLAVA